MDELLVIWFVKATMRVVAEAEKGEELDSNIMDKHGVLIPRDVVRKRKPARAGVRPGAWADVDWLESRCFPMQA